MHPLRTLACAFLLLIIPLSFQAEDVRWFEIKSGNFLLFTDTSEVKGRRLVMDLEQRVATFQAAFGVVPKRQFPIEIFLFKHSEDFLSSGSPVVPPDAGIDIYTSAFFLNGPDRMFVVAQDKSPEEIANDLGHTLGHVFLDRMVMWHPFWLEEAAGEYFRKTGRNPDGKRILPDERLKISDILKIVPSSTYKDSDPAGPFRIQAYRFFRIALEDHPVGLHDYIDALNSEEGRAAVLTIDESTATDRLNQFVDSRIPLSTMVPDIQSHEASESDVSVHRGDLMVAARQNIQAMHWYEGEGDEARVSRAILGEVLGGSDSEPVLARAARDFPGNGLVQFYFGSIETEDNAVLALQVDALERAVHLLPLMGRADAELARVLTRTGKADQALPLLDRAVSLEPEFADRFYLLRAEALVSLRRFDEAHKISEVASSLPHGDRTLTSIFDKQVVQIDKRIQDVMDATERMQVDQLRAAVEAEAARLEPPKPPPPPQAPVHVGKIDYDFEASSMVEVLNPVFAEYSDSLIKNGKSGKITLQVNIDSDGHVANAAITDSQIPEMNASTLTAVKQWTFKPIIRAGQAVPLAIKLTFRYSIQ